MKSEIQLHRISQDCVVSDVLLYIYITIIETGELCLCNYLFCVCGCGWVEPFIPAHNIVKSLLFI
jgi:hypothetical protein